MGAPPEPIFEDQAAYRCRVLEVSSRADEQDEQVSLDIYNAVWPHDAVTIDDVRSFYASARDHVDCVARIDGAAVGSAVGVILPQRVDRVFTIVTVLAEQRRRGVGSALYDAISAWAAERGLRELEVAVLDNDAESLGFAKRHGFAEERRELGVVLHLAEIAPPEVEPPDGVEIVTWAERPELARGMYEVSLEALPDIPGFEDDDVEPFDDWLAHDMQGSGDRPEATFVALAGEEVVGYAKLSLTKAQPTIAHHDLSAVKRAWRGRGVARALKAAQIGWAIDNGYTELRTRNEQRNEPIRRLNARFGYRPGIGRVYLVGPLSGS
jgi:GNAT superfamily N-acetyltransferase